MTPEVLTAWLNRALGALGFLAKLTPTTVDDQIIDGLKILASSPDFVAILVGLLELLKSNPQADVHTGLVDLMKSRSMLPK